MNYRIRKEYVWAGSIPDERGALAAKLRALSEGGLNLDLIVGRRDWSGHGMLFVSPLRTEEEIQSAQRAGLSMKDSFMALRVEGPNTPGLGAVMAQAIADAGITIRGYSASAIGTECVTTIAFDNREDTDKAKAVLEQTLAES